MRGEITNRTFDCYVPRGLLQRLVAARDEPVLTEAGTVVLVDISGFTRMSERLARTGREGAEHLVDTINACFSVLLADADEYGGSLLKFGGDALLLWFDGDEHPLRACAAAVAMRRTLRRTGRVRVGASDIVLRMSVGVHSGAYQTFLLGASHREHLIAGPAMSTVVELEAAAAAGQILLSEHTARQLPERCRGAACGPGVLLARAPAPHPWSRAPTPSLPSDDVVAGCLSTALRAHLLAAPAAPEHRTATVAFLELGHLDAMIDERGPTAAAEALGALVRTAQAAADHYEICSLASDVATDGAKLLFSAGAPRVVGDDEERMLLAMRQITEAGLELPVRIGINRGSTFTGEVGPTDRRAYVVMGDVTNLAARLAAKAPWGAIYTTGGVLSHSRTRFATTPVSPFTVKGKVRPVEAFELGPAARAEGPGAATTRLPLAGRTEELAVLKRSIAEARQGHGSLIDLVGDTGSGKSRLLAEAQALGADMNALVMTCDAYTRAVPYIGWRELLRQLLGVGWDDPDEPVLERLRAVVQESQPDLLAWLPLLAIAVGVEAPGTPEVDELSPDFRTAKLHTAVLSLLATARLQPTLVLVEHAHLMDEASAALLEALAARLHTSAWVVIVARRDRAGGFAAGEILASRVELGPLPDDVTLALAESTPEAHRVPPHMLRLAVERSAGNPAFLLELLAAAAGGSDVLPDSIEAAASARIDALDPGDRSLVRRASVLGLSFRPDRLIHVLEPGATDPDEATWERLAGVFVVDADGYRHFRSPSLCEAAYLGLPFRVRRTLHAAIGHALEPDLGREIDADPAVLSLHFSRAGDQARAWRYAIMGAERATARFAHADAARLYRRAIDAGRASGADPHELAGAWEALGEALRLTGEPKAALQALSTARRMLGQNPVGEARLCYRQADIAERHERLTSAVRWLLRGLRALAGLEDAEALRWRARLTADLGGIRMRQGRVADAVRLSQQAIAEAEPIGELRALARACYLLDWALVESGRRDEATHSRRALEIYDRLGDPEREARVRQQPGHLRVWGRRVGRSGCPVSPGR